MTTRQQRKWSIGLSLLLALSLGCDSRHLSDPPSVFVQAPSHPPLFIVLSGFNTCQTNSIYGKYSPYHSGMYKNVSKLIAQIEQKTGKQPELLLTCFGKTTSFYYVVGEDDFPHKTSSANIYGIIERVYKRKPGRPVYLIGHSHGGWLAMNVALKLGALLRPTRFYTLDPISRVHCTPGSMVKAYFRSMWEVRPHPGCVSNPPDFSRSQHQLIRSYVGTWKQFYQSTYAMLHASYQGYADRNAMLSYEPSYWSPHRPHIEIAIDARVWQVITRDVFSDLGL